MNPLVIVERNSDTWVLTLNRPDKLNALSSELVDALQMAVDQAHAQGARLLVFKGAGKSFCAGFDLSNLVNTSEADLVLRFIRVELLLQTIGNSPCSTLALAHGKVFGAGVDLFAACKERVAAADVVFRMPGLKFGLVLGTRRFAEIVGHETARRILEVTHSFDCDQAFQMNFVQSRVEANEWPEVIGSAAEKSTALDQPTQSHLYQVLGHTKADQDADLSNLVRSATRWGLKERLLKYVNGS